MFADHAVEFPCRHKHAAYYPVASNRSSEIVPGRQCRLPAFFSETLLGNPVIGRGPVDQPFLDVK